MSDADRGSPPRSPESIEPASARTARDAAVVVALVVVYLLLAHRLELFERVVRLTRGYEHWQLDELPLAMLVLALGMCWFAWRRTRETQRALAARTAAEQHTHALLQENRELAQALIKVQDAERRALARELHDEFGQHCTAIRADASYIRHAGGEPDVVESAERIARSAGHLNSMVREMLVRLRPPELDSLGLAQALQSLCERWEEQTGVLCHLTTDGLEADLSDDVAVTTYRLVQESLTNVARHAGASTVRVNVTLRDEARAPIPALHVRIEDDGRGLPADDVASQGRYGLLGMRERVAAVRGAIGWSTGGGGRGLRITASMPCPPARRESA